MSYWVIKDQDGDYLGPAAKEDGYAYSVGFGDAERFDSKLKAQLVLNIYLVSDKCAYSSSNSYTFVCVESGVEVDEEPDIALEARVAALEALVSRDATPTASPLQSASEDVTEVFTLSELKNSSSWYCGEDSAIMPTHERNGDLWALWEKAYWQGVEYAKECMTQAVEDIASDITEV